MAPLPPAAEAVEVAEGVAEVNMPLSRRDLQRWRQGEYYVLIRGS